MASVNRKSLIIFLWACAAVCAHGAAQDVEGFTEPIEVVQVASPEAGVVQQVLVDEGHVVLQGQALVSLESAVLRAMLATAQAKAAARGRIQSAQSTVRLRKKRLENLKALQAGRHASPEEVEKAQADYDAAVANLQIAKDQQTEARLEVERIRTQIKRRTILSPIQGVVLRLHRRAGEFASTAEPAVATIVRLDQLRVRLYPPTSLALQLAENQQVWLWFPEENQSYPAVLEFISPITDAESGTVRVEAILENAQQTLRSGRRCLLRPAP